MSAFAAAGIRTPDNSLISIPNNAVVNATVENLSLRMMRRQRFLIQVTCDTPRENSRPTTCNWTRPELVVERKLRQRQLTEDGNVEVTGRDCRAGRPGS